MHGDLHFSQRPLWYQNGDMPAGSSPMASPTQDPAMVFSNQEGSCQMKDPRCDS